MAIAHDAIFLKWNADTDHRAVLCFRDGHKDEMQVHAADVQRTIGTGELRGTFSGTWVEWEGVFYLIEEPGVITKNDGSDDVQVASSSDLLSAYAANDLKVQFHSGNEYIPVRWVSEWMAELKYDPYGDYQEMQASLWAIAT